MTTNTNNTNTVKVSETIQTVSEKTGIDFAYVNECVSFVKSGLFTKSFDIVSAWVRAGKVFAAIKKEYPKKQFNVTVDAIFGKKLSKDNRAYAIRLFAECDYNELKEWYLSTEQTVTSPKRVFSLFTDKKGVKKPSDKSDYEKAEIMLNTLKNFLSKGTFDDDQIIALSSAINVLANGMMREVNSIDAETKAA